MRLILPLGLASAALLLVTVVLGYSGRVVPAGSPAHVYAALVATTGVLFSQSVLVVYFLGISQRVREACRSRAAARRIVRDNPLPRSPVPMAAAAIVTSMSAFVLGGGAHTGALPPWLHGAVAVVAVGAQALSTAQERRAFRQVEQTVTAIDQRIGGLD